MTVCVSDTPLAANNAKTIPFGETLFTFWRET